MEFKEQYLTYEEYKALGGDLDLLPFNLFEFEVRKCIDIRTQNRLKKTTEIPSDVKICVFKMIEKIKGYKKSLDDANGNVASETTDGYSVSYVTNTQISDVLKSKHQELEDIMFTCLSGVSVDGINVLYLGVI